METKGINLSLFIRIIEATPLELEQIQTKAENEISTIVESDSSILEFYQSIMLAYYQSNTEILYTLYKSIRSKILHHERCQLPLTPEMEVLEILCKLRYEIRSNKLSKPYVKHSLPLLKNFHHWQGEIYFVYASALEKLNLFEEAKEMYEKSYLELKKIGANKKSLKALHNVLATSGRIDSTKRLIDDFLLLAREAYKQRVKNIAGVALLNISREYQIIGFYSLALRYATRARAMLRYDKNTLQYYLSLLYHAHILIDLERYHVADQLIASCKSCALPEIKSCLKIIISLRNRTPPHLVYFKKDEIIHPGWVERLYERDDILNTSELEEKLVYFLSDSPKKKNHNRSASVW